MGKQYSIWNILPVTKDSYISVIHRDLLKNPDFLSIGVKVNFSLFSYLSTLIINRKNKNGINEVIIKKSKLRNFIGKKIHSEKPHILNTYISDFIQKIRPLNIIHITENSDFLTVSFTTAYNKKIQKGNTVSFNLFDLTSIRGTLAKLTFLNLLSNDLRKEDRYFNLNFLAKKLNLNVKEKRISVIFKIKRALKSLSLKNFIVFEYYNYKDLKDGLYQFKFKLKELLQN